MNISLVLAVYNKLDLTKECYKHIRLLYPNAPLVISSNGSTDGTQEWLESLDDGNLKFKHSNVYTSFSDNYNTAIKMVETDKLVLIHNDMIIGEQFLENLESLLTENMVLSYTTVEPPIFAGHSRPGKTILDLGDTFDNFNYKLFNEYVNINKNTCELFDGATFFMCGYKKMFEDVGLFDGETFSPCFCEDDDFLIRASLKGYELKTTNCAITYHFVSKTSRFSKEFIDNRESIEINSNRNFIRKWGMPISSFVKSEYWKQPFHYKNIEVGLLFKSDNFDLLNFLEPFFNYIECDLFTKNYIELEQSKTNHNLTKKFSKIDNSNIIVEVDGNINSNDIQNLSLLRIILCNSKNGNYTLGNFKIRIL